MVLELLLIVSLSAKNATTKNFGWTKLYVLVEKIQFKNVIIMNLVITIVIGKSSVFNCFVFNTALLVMKLT